MMRNHSCWLLIFQSVSMVAMLKDSAGCTTLDARGQLYKTLHQLKAMCSAYDVTDSDCGLRPPIIIYRQASAVHCTCTQKIYLIVYFRPLRGSCLYCNGYISYSSNVVTRSDVRTRQQYHYHGTLMRHSANYATSYSKCYTHSAFVNHKATAQLPK